MRQLLLLLFLIAASANAAELKGNVVGVADGDTITVLDPDRAHHVVRLAGIDAPEKAQPFGNAARRHLVNTVIAREVVVQWHKRDRYGRLVGRVLLDGLDVNLEQVARGFAWHYVAYEREQSPDERLAYRDAERTASHLAIGLWSEPRPTAPWEWRRTRTAPGDRR